MALPAPTTVAVRYEFVLDGGLIATARTDWSDACPCRVTRVVVVRRDAASVSAGLDVLLYGHLVDGAGERTVRVPGYAGTPRWEERIHAEPLEDEIRRDVAAHC